MQIEGLRSKTGNEEYSATGKCANNRKIAFLNSAYKISSGNLNETSKAEKSFVCDYQLNVCCFLR